MVYPKGAPRRRLLVPVDLPGNTHPGEERGNPSLGLRIKRFRQLPRTPFRRMLGGMCGMLARSLSAKRPTSQDKWLCNTMGSRRYVSDFVSVL